MRSFDWLSPRIWQLGLVAGILLVTGLALGDHGAYTVTSAATLTTLIPVADAYVDSSTPTKNYGSSTQLRVDNSPIVRAFTRFSVQGLSGTPTKVTLRLYANSSQSIGYTVYQVADNSWGETTINYSNAPALGSSIGSTGAVVTNTWTSIDVTAYVTGNGTYSLGLATASSTALSLASREAGANAPQLIVESGGGATATNTLTAPTATSTRTPTAMATSTLARTATPTLTQAPSSTSTTTPSLASPTFTATPTLAPPTATPTGTGSTGWQPALPIQAAFFLPSYPGAWTQAGIYPYTNYHPSLGYYSSTDDAIIDQQLTLALYAHMQAMIASWTGPGQLTDTALQYLLARSERTGSPYPNLRWAVYYRAESGGDPATANLVSDLQYLSQNLFSHTGYLKVNNRPVVFVTAGANDGCSMADRWSQAKSQLGGNLYVVLKVFAGYTTCASQPDSWHQYSPAVGYDVQGKYSAVVSPGYWPKGGSALLARDSVRFESDVQKAVASGASWRLITSWNQWGEGSAVEPATEWGNTYIDVLCRNWSGSAPCSSSTTPTPTATATATPTRATGDPVIVAAGDIACDPADSQFNGGNGNSWACAMLATSNLIGPQNPAAVLVLGDNQYYCGGYTAFQQSYDLNWGRFKSITRPVVGNHEYVTAPGSNGVGTGCDSTNAAAAGYFKYFGAAAGSPSQGWYSYDVGTWHVIALNSNCGDVGGCGSSSPQGQWLLSDLGAHKNTCTLAYWHIPYWSSGGRNAPNMATVTQILYDNNADLVLTGHDHLYERFAPQNYNSQLDLARGIRAFVVGTGGANHTSLSTLMANSEVTNADTYGVLKLTLHANSYDWQFLPVPGGTFTDSGTLACH